MPNVRLRLEYDGTNFRGWQVQPGERTVQGVLEQAIEKVHGATVRATAAGRTDTGVHALDQVVNVALPVAEPAELGRSLNGVLPPDVSVLSADIVPDDFNARYDAVRRSYDYRITGRRLALDRDRAWWVKTPLDLDAMNRAAACLIGQHDFTSFCVVAHERENRICHVLTCTWSHRDDLIRLDIQSDRFVRSMVRSIVGTLVDVGRGFLDERSVAAILAARDRKEAGPTAPARGLFLTRVDYNI